MTEKRQRNSIAHCSIINLAAMCFGIGEVGRGAHRRRAKAKSMLIAELPYSMRRYLNHHSKVGLDIPNSREEYLCWGSNEQMK